MPVKIVQLNFELRGAAAESFVPGVVTEQVRNALRYWLSQDMTVIMGEDGSLYAPMGGGSYGRVVTEDSYIVMKKGEQRAYAFSRADGSMGFSPSEDRATPLTAAKAAEMVRSLNDANKTAGVEYIVGRGA